MSWNLGNVGRLSLIGALQGAVDVTDLTGKARTFNQKVGRNDTSSITFSTRCSERKRVHVRSMLWLKHWAIDLEILGAANLPISITANPCRGMLFDDVDQG